MKLIWIFACVCMAVVAWPVFAEADDKPVVAVYQIEDRGSGLDKKAIEKLTDHLRSQLAATGAFKVIPKGKYRGKIPVQMTVSTSISRVGDICVVLSSLYNLQKASTQATASEKGPCSEDKFKESIDKAVKKISKPPEKAGRED